MLGQHFSENDVIISCAPQRIESHANTASSVSKTGSVNSVAVTAVSVHGQNTSATRSVSVRTAKGKATQ